MKYRLVELLQCVRCQGGLDLCNVETRLAPNASGQIFPCERYCSLDGTTTIPAPSRCAECVETEIVTGTLRCRQCREEFHIVHSVPWLFKERAGLSGRLLSNTVRLYSRLWSGGHRASAHTEPTHVGAVEETLSEPVVRGQIGIDAGSGCGSDTAVMARRHPSVEVVSLDMSEGVYATQQRTEGMPNVHVVRGSVLSIPLRSEVCDFGYSFGVLHHTTDPLQGLKEIVRVLKPGGCVSLYLYEDHADSPWKAIPLKAVTALRRCTVRLNTRVLSALCYILSPFVVIAFSVPAQIMRRFGATRAIADQMPFNFGTTLFSVHGDLLDRFGAPIEVRYSREGVAELLRACQLTGVSIAKLKTLAGWVVSGLKSVANRANEREGRP